MKIRCKCVISKPLPSYPTVLFSKVAEQVSKILGGRDTELAQTVYEPLREDLYPNTVRSGGVMWVEEVEKASRLANLLPKLPPDPKPHSETSDNLNFRRGAEKLTAHQKTCLRWTQSIVPR